MIRHCRFLFWGVAASAMLLLSACATTVIEGSRHTLYDSVEALSGASSAIVVGTVVNQTVVTADMPYTVSELMVEDVMSPDSLGATEANGVSSIIPDQTINIRQVGSAAQSVTPAPLLAKGATYLLFIRPTRLPEEPEAGQFYVTGGVAGLYQKDGSAFVRVVRDSGDSLPMRLTKSDFE